MSDNNRAQNKTGKWQRILVELVMVCLFINACGFQSTSQVYRVGILNGFTPFSGVIDGFKAKMTELGYIEGQNIIYDLYEVNTGSTEEQRALEQLVADEVDLIFAFSTGSAIAAKAATQGTDIPVVFALGSVEGIDLVESVRQPGGNITGVRAPGAEAVVKRIIETHEGRIWVKSAGAGQGSTFCFTLTLAG